MSRDRHREHCRDRCREYMDPCRDRYMGGMRPVMPVQATIPMSGMCVMTPRGPVCHIMPMNLMDDMNRRG